MIRHRRFTVNWLSLSAEGDLRARQAPKQAPCPKAKRKSNETDAGALEDEPGIRRQARPLDYGPPEMGERQEREKSSCGDEIGLHRIGRRSKSRTK
jgi:hypothetical protein